jgi:hypothetical protein
MITGGRRRLLPVQPPISHVTISDRGTGRASRWEPERGQVRASLRSDGVKGAKAHSTQVQVRSVPGMSLVLLAALSKEPCWGFGGDPAVDHQVAARFRGGTKQLGPQIASAPAEEPRPLAIRSIYILEPGDRRRVTRYSDTNPTSMGDPPPSSSLDPECERPEALSLSSQPRQRAGLSCW